PGEASSSHVAFAASALHNLPMAARDVIFVDQRGTGRSEPRECDSAQQPDPLQQMSADLTTEQFVTASSTALRECLELLQQRGLPPEAWGTHVTVEDFELVRKALGIVRWNALSISYGTSVAMDYAARHPAAL